MVEIEVPGKPVQELDRAEVIEYLIDERVIHPPEFRTYDVDHTVAAYAYRLGRIDERENKKKD